MKPRKFYFTPYVAKHGKVKDERFPFVKIAKSGSCNFGKDTLEKLDLNKKLFYRLYVDKTKRSIGLVFSEKENLGDREVDGWKVWIPNVNQTTGSVKQSISIASFLSELDDVILPSARLPVGKYTDTDINQEFFWFRIPRGNEDPQGRKFEQ